MKEPIVVKLISESKADFEHIAVVLGSGGYMVVATSGIKFDPETKKHHQFLSVIKT